MDEFVTTKTKCCSKANIKQFFKNHENILVLSTILSVILATCISIPLMQLNLSVKTIYCISLPGMVLMNLLKMMIVPLLVLALLSGLTSLNLSTSGRMGLYTILYYTLTTFLAVLLGMTLVSTIKPGNPEVGKSFQIDSSEREVDSVESIINLFLNLFPDNIVRSTFQQVEVKFINKSTNTFDKNKTQITVFQEKPVTAYVNVTNFLGLIFFSIFFGIVINTMGEKKQLLIDLIVLLNDIIMKMITIILYYMPIGIFFLILGNLLSISNLMVVMSTMGMFAVVVLLGIGIHAFLILPLIYFGFVRKNPYRFLWGMKRAMLVAFVTQSSSVTMPVTMKCAQENNNIDSRVTKFMLPIGAIINMDGTGLYEAVAAIFIAQINGISLTASQMIRISFTSTLAAIGAATVPSAGLVTLLIVLSTAGLPTHQVSLLYSLDWFLDRCRTSINILGDAFGCGIIQKLCKTLLMEDRIGTEHSIDDDLEIADYSQNKSKYSVKNNTETIAVTNM